MHTAEDTEQNNDLQEDTAAHDDVQVHAASLPEDYTISVEQVREHFRSKGFSKSKDTVQRWCRTGDLDCQKRGVLGRYFTTETSLLSLEQKLVPDMIAENSKPQFSGQPEMQPDAAASEATRSMMPVHAEVDEPARSDMQENAVSEKPEHAAARTEVPQQGRAVPLNVGEELAKLTAENLGLREQLTEAKENNQFLREEIVSARGQRGDVVTIAERMLGTLETIAIGGRLERPRGQGSAADQSPQSVRFEEEQPEVHNV
ncbi:hypothetical protein [Sulfitobacter aestuariivivens]|uniref:hypothetical protein n=1 Tax=Sulfitobacter aestuariivivens TaxID=2766981 RepID=UPI00361544FF